MVKVKRICSITIDYTYLVYSSPLTILIKTLNKAFGFGIYPNCSLVTRCVNAQGKRPIHKLLDGGSNIQFYYKA